MTSDDRVSARTAAGLQPRPGDPDRAADHPAVPIRRRHHATKFFTALREEGKILATRDAEGNVMVPPRPVCGLSGLPMDGVGRGRARRRARRLHDRLCPVHRSDDRRTSGRCPTASASSASTAPTPRSTTCSTPPSRSRSASGSGSRPYSSRARSAREPRRHPPLQGGRLMSELVFDQKIDLPYVYTAGADAARGADRPARRPARRRRRATGTCRCRRRPFAPDGGAPARDARARRARECSRPRRWRTTCPARRPSA